MEPPRKSRPSYDPVELYSQAGAPEVWLQNHPVTVLDQLDLPSEKTEPCSLADPTYAGPVPLPSNLTNPTEDVTSFVSKHHDPWTQ